MKRTGLFRICQVIVLLWVVVVVSCGSLESDDGRERHVEKKNIEIGTPTWTEVITETSPAPRVDVALAYDSKRKKLVLFGGWDNRPEPDQVYDDTWEFDGRRWRKINPENHPMVRAGAGMCYCREWDMMILYGGSNSSTFFADTWRYHEGEWEQINTPVSPPKRAAFGMVYDESLNRVVLYGGGYSTGYYYDTWTFDGTNWEKIDISFAHNGPQEPAMVYDSRGKRTLLFGGFDNIYYPDNSLWAFNGTTWTLINTPTKVPARIAPGFAYDRYRGVFILFSGGTMTSLNADTWEYDGTDWRKIETQGAPERREDSDMCYMDHDYRSILFGGRTGGENMHNDTWAYSAITFTSAITMPAEGGMGAGQTNNHWQITSSTEFSLYRHIYEGIQY